MDGNQQGRAGIWREYSEYARREVQSSSADGSRNENYRLAGRRPKQINGVNTIAATSQQTTADHTT